MLIFIVIIVFAFTFMFDAASISISLILIALFSPSASTFTSISRSLKPLSIFTPSLSISPSFIVASHLHQHDEPYQGFRICRGYPLARLTSILRGLFMVVLVSIWMPIVMSHFYSTLDSIVASLWILTFVFSFWPGIELILYCLLLGLYLLTWTLLLILRGYHQVFMFLSDFPVLAFIIQSFIFTLIRLLFCLPRVVHFDLVSSSAVASSSISTDLP